MKTSGSGTFFDGVTSARREVAVALAPLGVQIRSADGTLLAEWAYADIGTFSAPAGVVRLGLAKSPVLARLDIRDAELAAALTQHAGAIERGGVTSRRTQLRVVAWSLGAAVSLILVAVYGIPALATQLAPLVPIPLELRLGTSVDRQVRMILDQGRRDRPFECAGEPAARAAFDKLVGKLETAAALPFPLNAKVIRMDAANAFALPGGHVYVFQGLIDKARSPDELAGVIAHEMGHVAHRDGMRTIMQAAGLSFVFGMLLGDFGGGGAAIIAVRTVLQSAYTRDVEAAADAYGATLVAKIGGDPRALGAILLRIAGTGGPFAKFLLDHPEAKDRAAAIDAFAGPRAPKGDPDGVEGRTALLDASEWTALKRICATGARPGGPGK